MGLDLWGDVYDMRYEIWSGLHLDVIERSDCTYSTMWHMLSTV